MNLSKKILILILCLISVIGVMVGVLVTPSLSVYQPCWIIRDHQNYLIMSQLKPHKVGHENQYELTLHQDQHEDKVLVDQFQFQTVTYHDQTWYLCQVQHLQTYYNLQKPIYLKEKQISMIESWKL